MKAIFEKKTELVASYQTVADLNGYLKEIKTTFYLFRIPIFYTHKFLTIPAEAPESEIPQELHNTLSRFPSR